MTLAMRLAQAGRKVTIVESADHLGGLADPWQIGEWVWDRHYHVIVSTDVHLRDLLKELGLDAATQWRAVGTGFYSRGQLYSISNAWEFLRFPILSLFQKFRWAFTIWRGSQIRRSETLDHVLVSDWLRRYSGERVFETIWRPLLQSKLGNAYQKTSARFIWTTIQRLYEARKNGKKQEEFGFVQGGYRKILETMQRQLTELGVEIRLGFKTSGVTRTLSGNWEVLNEDGSSISCSDVIVTTPAPVTAKICSGLSEPERERLLGVEYLGIVCPSLVLKRSLSEYYVTNITDSGFPFTGVIEMTALVPKENFSGNALVYLPKYETPDAEIFRESDESIRSRFVAALIKMHPELREEDVLAFRVSRVRSVMAIPTLGYLSRVPKRETTQPGLWIANSAQITDGTLNVNETVRLANETAKSVLAAGANSLCHEEEVFANAGGGSP